MHQRSRLASTMSRSRVWPHHQVATLGSFSSSPSSLRHSRGRKPSRALDSSTPSRGC